MLYGVVVQMPVEKTRFRSVMSAFANAEYSGCAELCRVRVRARVRVRVRVS